MKGKREGPESDQSHGQPGIVARECELLFESIDQAFCLLEVIFNHEKEPVDFIVRKVNPAYLTQTGIRNPLGKSLLTIHPNLETHWREAWTRVSKSGKPEKILGESKELGRWYLGGVYPLKGEEVPCRYIAALFMDVTDRINFERMLQNSVRNKDQILATLGHELRNPLAAVSAGLEVMNLSMGQPDLHQKAYITAKRQARQLATLVEDLLEASSVSLGKLKAHKEKLRLADIIRDAVEAAELRIRSAGQRLSVDLPQGDIFLNADATLLVQVFSNLLDNASKYTPNGGQIRIDVNLKRDKVIIGISDTGIGIPVEDQEKIFEMFTQLDSRVNQRHSGLGLGLSLSKSLVELHNGSIEVHSQGLGQGSTFQVCLPILRKPKRIGPVRKVESIEEGSRVLVVDDNVDAARMLAELCRISGCDVRMAYDGNNAVELASQFTPKLILMDLSMEGVDGFEAARRIREQGGAMRIVALSGWGLDKDRQRSKAAGFDEHLVKPLQTSKLKTLLSGI